MVNETKKTLSANEQLLLQNKIANRTQWIKEVKSQELQLENIKKIMKIFDEQRQLQLDNSEIMFSKYKLLKPTWEFETDEKYISNHKRLQELALEAKEMELDAVVISRNADYERILKQKEDLQKELTEMDSNIEKLKGE